MQIKNTITQSPHFEELFQRYEELKPIRDTISEAFYLLRDGYERGGKLLLCGNGGSQADADHIVGELMKGFLRPRTLSQKESAQYAAIGKYLQHGLPAISLSHPSSLFTAYINDINADTVFAQSVYVLGKEGDMLLAISTSGNAPNIVNAAMVAKAKGMTVIGLTGSSKNRLGINCDVCISAPGTETYKIQELHLPIYHCLCAMLEEHFFS